MEWKERRQEAYAIFPLLCPHSFSVLIGPSSLYLTPTPSHYQPSSISKEFFYSLILHWRFSSLIFFNACHFVIPSPLVYVAHLIWNAWVSGTDIWTVLCGRLFVAPMRGISFGVSKRMHPTEWENLTIDRQTDRQTQKEQKRFQWWRMAKNLERMSCSPLDMSEWRTFDFYAEVKETNLTFVIRLKLRSLLKNT